jgi:hypothetical protein
MMRPGCITPPVIEGAKCTRKVTRCGPIDSILRVAVNVVAIDLGVGISKDEAIDVVMHIVTCYFH